MVVFFNLSIMLLVILKLEEFLIRIPSGVFPIGIFPPKFNYINSLELESMFTVLDIVLPKLSYEI